MHPIGIDSQNESGVTPLHWASDRGILSVGQYLLDHGVDINARDEDSLTPLFDTAGQGHYVLLMSPCADIDDELYNNEIQE